MRTHVKRVTSKIAADGVCQLLRFTFDADFYVEQSHKTYFPNEVCYDIWVLRRDHVARAPSNANLTRYCNYADGAVAVLDHPHYFQPKNQEVTT